MEKIFKNKLYELFENYTDGNELRYNIIKLYKEMLKMEAKESSEIIYKLKDGYNEDGIKYDVEDIRIYTSASGRIFLDEKGGIESDICDTFLEALESLKYNIDEAIKDDIAWNETKINLDDDRKNNI